MNDGSRLGYDGSDGPFSSVRGAKLASPLEILLMLGQSTLAFLRRPFGWIGVWACGRGLRVYEQ